MLFVQVGTKHYNINEAKHTVLDKNVKDNAPSCILQLYHLLYLSCIIYFQLHAVSIKQHMIWEQQHHQLGQRKEDIMLDPYSKRK